MRLNNFGGPDWSVPCGLGMPAWICLAGDSAERRLHDILNKRLQPYPIPTQKNLYRNILLIDTILSHLVGLLMSSSATRPSGERVPRLKSDNFIGCHTEAEQEDHNLCHIILTHRPNQ